MQVDYRARDRKTGATLAPERHQRSFNEAEDPSRSSGLRHYGAIAAQTELATGSCNILTGWISDRVIDPDASCPSDFERLRGSGRT